jgi:hypothetical protein
MAMATVCSTHQRAERKGVRFRKGGFMGSPPEKLKRETESNYQENIIFPLINPTLPLFSGVPAVLSFQEIRDISTLPQFCIGIRMMPVNEVPAPLSSLATPQTPEGQTPKRITFPSFMFSNSSRTSTIRASCRQTSSDEPVQRVLYGLLSASPNQIYRKNIALP